LSNASALSREELYLLHIFQSAADPNGSNLSSFSELAAARCPPLCEFCRRTGDCVQTAEYTSKDLCTENSNIHSRK